MLILLILMLILLIFSLAFWWLEHVCVTNSFLKLQQHSNGRQWAIYRAQN
jgi:hypothetical protein